MSASCRQANHTRIIECLSAYLFMVCCVRPWKCSRTFSLLVVWLLVAQSSVSDAASTQQGFIPLLASNWITWGAAPSAARNLFLRLCIWCLPCSMRRVKQHDETTQSVEFHVFDANKQCVYHAKDFLFHVLVRLFCFSWSPLRKNYHYFPIN